MSLPLLLLCDTCSLCSGWRRGRTRGGDGKPHVATVATTLMEVDGGKPLVRAAAAGELADVGRFAGVETGVDEHVGALGEGFAALRTWV